METKNNIFFEHLKEYAKADKKGRSLILDHLCFVTKLQRKSAIRRMSNSIYCRRKPVEKRGRKIIYNVDVTLALKSVWKLSGEICGELLHPIIGEYIDNLKREKHWVHGEIATQQLLVMSQSTVKRRLSKFIKFRDKRHGLSSTSPSALKAIIPIFTGPWKHKPPGWGQIDSVAHCGTTLVGAYVYTLTYIDACTFWIGLSAQWNKGQIATQGSMASIKSKLPFLWLGAHPDTGSEFINYFVYDWCQKEKIDYSRSRPNHKNDNMYVEERNAHVVRKYLGYIRLDCADTVVIVNQFYQILELYLNHFIPVRRTLKKERIGSRYHRVYEKVAKTPYQRLMESKKVNNIIKAKQKAIHQRLNLFFLKQEIERLTILIYNTQQNYGNQKS